jgi:hypothetical protein
VRNEEGDGTKQRDKKRRKIRGRRMPSIVFGIGNRRRITERKGDAK